MQFPGSRISLIGGVAAAITASLCCVGPLVLLTLGVSGAWIAQLTALEPVRPIFVGLTVMFIGLAFHRLYLTPSVCAPGQSCANPNTRTRQRIAFWTTTTLIVVLLAVPLIAPYFY